MMAFSRRFLLAGVAILAASPSAHASTSCAIPGFTNAAFGFTSVSIGNGNTDSYTAPTYSAPTTGGTCSAACTPSTACQGGVGTATGGGISVGAQGCVDGTCQDAYGGSTGAISGSSHCEGTGVEGQPVSAASVTVPSYANWVGVLPAILTPGYTYGSLSGSLEFTNGTYVINSLSTSGNDNITVQNPSTTYDSTKQTTIIITGSSGLSLSGNGTINSGGSPANFIIMCADTVTSVSVSGNGNTAFAVYCPNAAVTVNGAGSNGAIYGAIVGKTVTMNGNGTTIHYDSELAGLVSSQIDCTPTEVSRASPVLAQVTSGSTNYTALVQGSYGFSSGAKTSISATADVPLWTFPWITGHMRARDATTITTTASKLGSTTTGVIFDAATTGNIPTAAVSCTPPLNGTCRYVFTNVNAAPAANTGSTFFTRPATGCTTSACAQSDANVKVLSTTDGTIANAVGGLIASNLTYPTITSSDYLTMVNKILAGTLGGVDRSTVAVIQASLFTNSGSRPTMVYFGGTDGMLHAVCASVGGATHSQSGSVCPALGTELWAFIPRVQLPLFRTNDQRVDGSVHVIDAFGDFVSTTGSGTKSWRTILVFQTGANGTSTNFTKPGAYALDVTDPAAPVLLWEYTTETSQTPQAFGFGMWSVAGTTLINGQARNIAVFETNNGVSSPTNTTTPGVLATAVSLETGSQLWQFKNAYTVTSVPWAAIPGGAVGVDLTGNGYFTDILFGDLYGWLWRVNANDGTSAYGSGTPLFKFSYVTGTTVRPIGSVPGIYSDGSIQYATVASGGYADQYDLTTSWSKGNQYMAAVKVKSSVGSVADSGPSNSATGNLRLLTQLDANTKNYSQPTIVGNQMLVTSDSAEVNSIAYGTSGVATGHVLTANGLNGSVSTQTYSSGTTSGSIYGGASSVAAGTVGSSTVIYASSSDKQMQVGTAGISGSGTGVAASSGSLGAGANVGVGATTKLTRTLWLRTL